MKFIVLACLIGQAAFLQAAITTIHATERSTTVKGPESTTKGTVETTTTAAWNYHSSFVNNQCNFTACTTEHQCQCLNDRPPAGLRPDQIPQFVLVTFDGAITVTNFPYYKELFAHKNPSGCPIRSTYFVSHMDTNYIMVHELYRQGNEIAAHSISKAVNSGQTYWKTLDYQGWKNEFGGQKQILSKYADIPVEAIKGARAPNLQTNGNETIAALFHENYKYDCSYPSRLGIKTPFFPYTMDYGFQRVNDCPVQPCPPLDKSSYKGFWEVPLNDWQTEYVVDNVTVTRECAEASACLLYLENGELDYHPSEQKIFDLFMNNFNRYYKKNRAPFPVFLSEEWMGVESHRKGFNKFIEEVKKNKDVYFVTIEELIEWMEHPSTLAEYSQSRKCKEVKETACGIDAHKDFQHEINKKHCDYKDIKELKVLEKRLFICPDVQCPDRYPWVAK